MAIPSGHLTEPDTVLLLLLFHQTTTHLPSLPFPPPLPPLPKRVSATSDCLTFRASQKVFNAKGISTSIKSRVSLREILVKPKDQLEKEKQVGLLYHIPCAGANSIPCSGTYVGETERTVSARFQEHTSTSTNALGHYKSAMLQHARESGHHFRKNDVSILAREQNWVQRGIKEALYIKALSPSINIDPGRHSLSSHFDSILKDLIHAPPPPEPHNAQTETLINTAPRRQGRPRNQPVPTIPATAPQPQQQQQPLQQRENLSQRRSQRLRERQTQPN